MITNKIVLVGPVYPYKGGISHYTGLLCQSLEKKYVIKTYSFKVQYPKILYPGTEQKDFSESRFKTDNVSYLINSINPATWLITAIKIIMDKPELLIIQWWNPFFAFCFGSIAFKVKLFSKCKVLFICHNVLPHERMPMQYMLAKVALSKGDMFIVHSSEDEAKLLRLLPWAKCRRAVHPTYNMFKSEKLPGVEEKNELKFKGKKVLLFFGFVRGYKGLMHLIHAISLLNHFYDDIVLLIVGEFFQDKNQYLEEIKKLNLEGKIIVYDGYIPDQEVGKYFSVADIVILPYLSATQSGIVQIAYAFNKPVIVTNVGGLPEVVAQYVTGYVVEPAKPEQIAEAVLDFYQNNNLEKFSQNIEKENERFSWDRLVEIIEEAIS